MGLNVAKGVISSPAATGTQTYSLAANFNPKALICWWSNQTAEGIANDAQLGVGFATYRGAAVQQFVATATSDDATAAASGSVYTGGSYLGRLVTPGATTPSIAWVVFVSFATGDPSNFVLDWQLLPTTGTKLHYLVLGGSDITDAWVSNGTLPQAETANIAAPAGFGQPDLVLSLSTRSSVGSNDTLSQLMFGVAASNTSRRCAVWNDDDGSANMDVGYLNKDRAILFLNDATNAIDAEADLSAKASWPTDGFQLTIADQPGASSYEVGYLQLKGTFQSVIGSNSSPTGAPTVNQDNACGFAPLAAMVFGSCLDPITTVDTTHPDLGQFYVGATDGTNEGWAGMSQDDGNGTADTYSYHSESKAIQIHTGGGGILLAEADASFSGNNFRLAWNDTDAYGREYNWFALGAAAVAAAPIPDVVMARRAY